MPSTNPTPGPRRETGGTGVLALVYSRRRADDRRSTVAGQLSTVVWVERNYYRRGAMGSPEFGVGATAEFVRSHCDRRYRAVAAN